MKGKVKMNKLTYNGIEVIDSKVTFVDPHGVTRESTMEKLVAHELKRLSMTWWDADPAYKSWGLSVHGCPPPSYPYNREDIVRWATKKVKGTMVVDQTLINKYLAAYSGITGFLGTLMPVGYGNVRLTKYAQEYHASEVHTVVFDTNSGLYRHVPVIEVQSGMELCKPSRLKMGVYGSMVVQELKGCVDQFKATKRLKLLLGWEVIAMIPRSFLEPKRVKVMKLTDGIMLVSRKVAEEFSIMGMDLEWHPLESGDKVAGVIQAPQGPMLLKATIIVTSTPGYSIVVGEDCIKNTPEDGIEYNANTRAHIQSRAEDRVSNHIGMSYQMSEMSKPLAKLARSRISNIMRLPRWVSKSLEGDAEIITLSANDVVTETYKEASSYKDMIEGKGTIEEYAWLFKMPNPIGSDDDGDPLAIKWSLGVQGRRILTNKSIVGCETAIREKLTQNILSQVKYPVKGCYWVCIPHRNWVSHNTPIKGEDDVVSIPKCDWERLGCPETMAILRYPIKGESSLIKVTVKYHEDNHCIEMSPLMLEIVLNGDCDGDLVCGIVDKDVVSLAWDFIKAWKLSLAAKAGLKEPREMRFCNESGNDITLTPAQISTWVGANDRMGLYCRVRDNVVDILTEEQKLRFFEFKIQPSIAVKEGKPLVQGTGDEREIKVISNELGIDPALITAYTLKGVPYLNSTPRVELNALIGKSVVKDDAGNNLPITLVELLEMANRIELTEDSTAHEIILSGFAGIKMGELLEDHQKGS